MSAAGDGEIIAAGLLGWSGGELDPAEQAPRRRSGGPGLWDIADASDSRGQGAATPMAFIWHRG